MLLVVLLLDAEVEEDDKGREGREDFTSPKLFPPSLPLLLLRTLLLLALTTLRLLRGDDDEAAIRLAAGVPM